MADGTDSIESYWEGLRPPRDPEPKAPPLPNGCQILNYLWSWNNKENRIPNSGRTGAPDREIRRVINGYHDRHSEYPNFETLRDMFILNIASHPESEPHVLDNWCLARLVELATEAIHSPSDDCIGERAAKVIEDITEESSRYPYD